MLKLKNCLNEFILKHPVLAGIDGILTIVFFIWFVGYITH